MCDNITYGGIKEEVKDEETAEVWCGQQQEAEEDINQDVDDVNVDIKQEINDDTRVEDSIGIDIEDLEKHVSDDVDSERAAHTGLRPPTCQVCYKTFTITGHYFGH